MPINNPLQIKEKILSFVRLKGPSLPVNIAKETGLSILFASAFLSELYGDKELKMSNLRVGSSPLYFIEGQEPRLETYSQYLKSKEKEAFQRLKENNFLKDSEQEPAIRVALREIKDFAVPFKSENEVYWRYFTVSEEQFSNEEKVQEIIVEKAEEIISIEPEEEIKTEALKKEKAPKKAKTESKSKRQPKKKDDSFFNKIKEFLEKEKIEILNIENFKNDEAILKIKKKGEEELLFVFNQKKISEKEILASYKKASEKKMKYSVYSFGEVPKRLGSFIDAVNEMSDIGKIE